MKPYINDRFSIVLKGQRQKTPFFPGPQMLPAVFQKSTCQCVNNMCAEEMSKSNSTCHQTNTAVTQFPAVW
jgi:hypothetical protein